MSDVLESPQKPVRADFFTRFTPQRARQMAALRAKLRAERANSPPTPPPQPQAPPEQKQDDYSNRRLGRVREQLDLLDAHMASLLGAEAKDEQAIERTARASRALSELEQELSMRPLPGTLKPDSRAVGRAVPRAD